MQTISRQMDIEAKESYRHWSPESETFARGDALASLLDDGWKVHGVVFRQEFWHADRRTIVYHFKLEKGGDMVRIPVLQTPYIARLLATIKVQVVQINHRKEQCAAERW